MKVPLKVYLHSFTCLSSICRCFFTPGLNFRKLTGWPWSVFSSVRVFLIPSRKTNGVTSTSFVYFYSFYVSLYFCETDSFGSFEVGPRVTMRHSREPMNSSCRRNLFVETPQLECHNLCSKFCANSFFPPFFCAPNWRPLRKEAATSIERISTTASTFTSWLSSDRFLPRTWGAKTIPRRSLAASSRGKI